MPNLTTRAQRRKIAAALKRLPKKMCVSDVTEGAADIQVPDMRPVVLQNCRDCELRVSGHLTKLSVSNCRNVTVRLMPGARVQTRMLLVMRSTGLRVRTLAAVDHVRVELSHSCVVDVAAATAGLFSAHHYRSFNIELRLPPSSEEEGAEPQTHLLSCDPLRPDNTLIASVREDGTFQAAHGVPNSHGTSLQDAAPGLTVPLNLDVATSVIADFDTSGLYSIIAPAADARSVPLAHLGGGPKP